MSVSMCDNIAEDRLNNNHPEVHHCKILSDDIGALALCQEYSDVKFIVDGRSFPGHRVILAARCHYFRALLFGGMRESQAQAEIRIDDATADAFELLLRYIYTGKLKLHELSEELMLEVLALSNKYGFEALEKAISDFLLRSIDISNACDIFEVATLYSLVELKEAAAEFIDGNAARIINADSFSTLSLEAVTSLIKRDSFCTAEKAIFKAVEKWWDYNKFEPKSDEDRERLDSSQKHLLAGVRLPLIPLQDLLTTVRKSGLIPPDTLLDAIQRQSEQSEADLNYRGVLCPEENVATFQHSAQVINGEITSALLDGDTVNYDMEKGFTRHSIEDAASGSKRESGIVVKLGNPTIINHIRMLLWDRDARAYSYYVEVSMNSEDWVRVIDYSEMNCRSWQMLFFERRVVSYIRVVGTNNTANRVFHLVSLEAMFTRKEEITENGMIVPQANVATLGRSAMVIEGVSRDRNALLNGEICNYDWDSGYTCHQLGNGQITVQLSQPYIISSMRLLLWDIDDRSYGYYIEVSVDYKEWHRVIDNSNKECRSWQSITFPRRPVVYIRIIGTRNTANEVFHCVHFECPDATLAFLPITTEHSDESGDGAVAEILPGQHYKMEDIDSTDDEGRANEFNIVGYPSPSPPRMHDAPSSRSSNDENSPGEGRRSMRHHRALFSSACQKKS